MDTPLELSFHNTAHSEFLEQRIRERVARLHKRFAHINSCRIAVEAPHRNNARALGFRVRLEVRVPEKELVVSRDPGDEGERFDPSIVVRDAFDAMERQLERYSGKLRGEVKTHAAPMQGRVLRLFPDYGFIAATDGREIYFHRNAVINGGFEDLTEGSTVELALVDGESEKGPQATSVRPIGPMRFTPDAPKEGLAP
jgi:cold shock CspA family protein/ribosome-associated translation inhibitor RaiA